MPSGPPTALTFYPTFCWTASPTYNVWVKISAVDVHKLQRKAGFEPHNRVWFYRNHPIRFVRLVGVVTAFEEASETTEIVGPDRLARTQQRPHNFTLDDGSGAAVQVVLWKRARGEQKIACWPGELIELGPLDFNTSVGRSISGDLVDIECVKLGQVVKVKGWVGEHRGEKQILLERVSLVSDTVEEVAEWERLAAFQEAVLSKPWALTADEVKSLRRRDERSRRRLETRAKMKQQVDLLDPSQPRTNPEAPKSRSRTFKKASKPNSSHA